MFVLLSVAACSAFTCLKRERRSKTGRRKRFFEKNVFSSCHRRRISRSHCGACRPGFRECRVELLNTDGKPVAAAPSEFSTRTSSARMGLLNRWGSRARLRAFAGQGDWQLPCMATNRRRAVDPQTSQRGGGWMSSPEPGGGCAAVVRRHVPRPECGPGAFHSEVHAVFVPFRWDSHAMPHVPRWASVPERLVPVKI